MRDVTANRRRVLKSAGSVTINNFTVLSVNHKLTAKVMTGQTPFNETCEKNPEYYRFPKSTGVPAWYKPHIY